VYQGPPGYIHGGIIATLMNEVMSKLNRPLNATAMTRHMEIDYLRPAPLDQPLTLVGTHLSRNGRKLFHQAELRLPDGTVLASAKGLFIALSPDQLSSRQKPRTPASEILPVDIETGIHYLLVPCSRRPRHKVRWL
jgi:acyl-CoA thioesterase FadM